MASPPKPWERLNVPSAATTTATAIPSTIPATSAVTTTTQQPTVPERPEPFASTSAAPYSSYSSPYSRLGTGYGGVGYGGYGMNSMYGGGYGYNSMYGSGMYGGGMYGGGMGGMYGGMGMGMPGMMGPNGQPSLSQTLESTTQHTFALLQSIVQTFSGVAQMLESTFMATHSSFFAMVGVIEQFGQLRNALGHVLGLFGLVRWAQDVVRGRTGMRGEFQDFVNGKPIGQPTPAGPRPSKKPLIMFLLAIVGVPYAFTKLIRLLAARQEEQLALQPGLGPLDASQLTFARALYQFTPSSSKELALQENDIVAITAKFDPRTNQEVDPRTDLSESGGGEWWKGRTRDGREGWFPKKWVEIIERKKPAPDS